MKENLDFEMLPLLDKSIYIYYKNAVRVCTNA